MRKVKTVRGFLVVAALAGMAAWEGGAQAASPIVGIPVTLGKASAALNVPAAFQGRADFVSDGIVLYQESVNINYQRVDGSYNQLEFTATGGGNSNTFDTIFANPGTTILTAPNLRVRLYRVLNNVPTLLTEQDYPASGIGMWAVHSLDTAGLQAADTQFAADLAAEIQARTSGDAAISNSLSAEIARAKGAEANLATANSVESQSRMTADVNLSQAISLETDRAMAAEALLQLQINQGNNNNNAALNAEIAARKQGDADTLAAAKMYTDQQVGAEAAARAAADNNEAAARAAADMAEANARAAGDAAEAAARAAGDAAEAAARTNGDNSEAAARMAADAALQAAIDAINGVGGGGILQQANNYTDQQVNIEIAARKQGDADTLAAAKLYTDQQVAAEANARAAADTTLANDLAAEIARAKAAEAMLGGDIGAEVARAQGAEAALTNDLNNEIVRAKNAEATLTTNLNNEVARAQGAETTLTNNLNAEIARATNAENGKANVTLNNLGSVAVNISILPGATNTINLGSGAKTWKTLFLNNNSNASAGINFQPSGGGIQTLLTAAPANVDRTITLPNASGTVAVSASGNVALDAAGNVTFTGILPIANGGTNNNSFTNGKFVAYDGSKLASTNFDSASFAQANASITVTAGAGLSGGGNVALGGTVTLANAGVTGLVGGGGITVSGATGNVTLGSSSGGDLSGPLSAAMVTGLRGRVISPAAPAVGQVLAWDGGSWSPANGAVGNITGNGNANRITKWTGAGSVGNSSISDDGMVITAMVALNSTAGLGMSGDYRTSWNNQDANSVNPMPRTCGLGQVAVARGNFKWDCSVICPLGAADCDMNQNNGCEIGVASDKFNCGSCGVVCSGNNIAATSCSQGVCNGACNAGFADCNGNKQSDGCEIGIANDANNCGSCGTICSQNNMATRTCGGGVCNGACNASFADCNGNKQVDGCETSVGSDPNNCGGCAFVCSNLNMQTRTCGGGTCNGSCNVGFSDCNNNKLADGCESNLSNDVNNCGGCGTTCSANNVNRVCGGGSCQAGVCNAGFADCNVNKQVDGCEINTTNNVSHCGACGNACPNVPNGTRGCAASACVIAACNANFYNVNGAYGDGCECNAPGLNSCGASDNLGQMGWGGNQVFSGVIPGGSGEHWYTINFANSGAAYHPHILLAGGNYTMDVFNGCGGGQFNCGNGGTSAGTLNWEVNQSAGDPGSGCGCFTWATPSPGTQLWIRVRAMANTACNSYTINFRNDGG